MNWELDSVLEQSISQIVEGKARVESCLLAYPALAGDLGPLLLVSEELLAVPKPVMSPEAKARIEDQILKAAVSSGLARRERKPLPRPRFMRLPFVLPHWRWTYSALAAMVIVALLMTTTLVGAANALPGSTLYSVKLAAEDAWLWVATARDEPALHLRFAQRRLAEYQALVEQGVYDESLLDEMVDQVDAALAGIEELPPAVALVLLDQAAEVVAEQQEVLSEMRADLPAASQGKLDRIMASASAHLVRMKSMRWTLRTQATGTTSPGLELTLLPTGTLEPGGLLAATYTPTSSTSEEIEGLPDPTSTATSGGTEPTATTGTTPTATSVPTAQATPTPTPVPPEEEPTKQTPPGLTKTPQPPGLMTRTPYP